MGLSWVRASTAVIMKAMGTRENIREKKGDVPARRRISHMIIDKHIITTLMKMKAPRSMRSIEP